MQSSHRTSAKHRYTYSKYTVKDDISANKVDLATKMGLHGFIWDWWVSSIEYNNLLIVYIQFVSQEASDTQFHKILGEYILKSV